MDEPLEDRTSFDAIFAARYQLAAREDMSGEACAILQRAEG